jgi:membrane-associated phospholipid phosphatase
MGAWLCLLFYGTDTLTGWRRFRVPVHLPFERDLPLVPGLIIAYLSIHAVFALAPFALPTRRPLRVLMGTLAVIIGVASVGFLLLPADLAFPPATGLGIWERPFRLADRLNGDHNLVPSLHVALSVTCLAAYAGAASALGAWLLWGWAALIAVSTVLTHQHHVLDAVTGFALGLAGHQLMRARLTGEVSSGRELDRRRERA